MSNLPKGWEIKSIKDLKLDISDGNYSSKYPTQNDFIECGVPFIRANNIKSMTVIDKDMRFISEKQHNELKKGHLKKNDILITTRGDIGQVSLVPDKYIGANINAQIVRIGVSESIFFKYLAYILTYEETQKNIKSLETGTALKQLPVKKLDLLNIPLPPLEEQKKIADILTTVDKKIAFVEENISATEELKKGLMQKLLTEGIGHTEFKDSELGRIPESWEVKKLGDIGSLEGGYAFKSGEYNIEEKGYQVIRMSNINTFGLNLVKDPKYLESIEEKAKKYILSMGDILITLTGTIGKTDYGNVAFIDIDKPMVLNQRVGRFVPKKNNYNKFFFYVFNFSLFRNKFFEFGQGGTGNQANVGKNDFESIEIIVPPLEEQKQIAEILSTVDKKIENLKEKKLFFEELKKGLMQKLLTGEVRV